MERRSLLATGVTGLAVAAAGCLGDSGQASGETRELRLTLSPYDGTLRERYVVDLGETPQEWDEAAFEAALRGESYTTQHHTPFYSEPDDPKYAVRDGTHYELGSVVVDEARETHPVLRLSTVEDAEDGAGVDAESLPEGDRRAVRIAHMAARARGDVGGVPWGLVQRGGYVYRKGERIQSSELLTDDGPDRVRYRDETYEVRVDREQFYEPIYRATVEPVAESPEGMEAVLRAKFVDARVSRDDLSRDARGVLREAAANGYAESHPYSEGFRTVLTELRRRAYLDGNVKKDAFLEPPERGVVRYDGDYYGFRLRFLESGQ